MTRIDIDDAKMKVADNRLKKLGQEWDTFAKNKKLDEQVKTWWTENKVDDKLQGAQTKVSTFVNELDTKNKIAEWAKTHKVEQRVKNIENIVKNGIKVTDTATTAQLPQNSLEMTRIDIDDAKMKIADNRLKKLGQEWDTFAKNKKLDEQVKTWWTENKVDDKLQGAQTKVSTFVNELDTKNKIAEWAKTHKVEQRVKNIENIVKNGIKVTDTATTAQLPQNSLEMTRIDIDDAKMKIADNRLKKLGQEWDTFAKNKKLDEQVESWWTENKMDDKLESAQNKTSTFVNELDKKNKIA
jgi:uncharacterized protein YbcI